MIDTGELLYVQQPKTGTVWSDSMLKAELRGKVLRSPLRRHTPARIIPAELRHARKVVGTCRTPEAWYRSAHKHVIKNKQAPMAWFGKGKNDFRSVLYGMTHPWELDHFRVKVAPVILAPGGFSEQWQDFRCGVWSWSTHWFYRTASGEWAVDALVDTEHMYDGWAEVTGLRKVDLAARGRTHVSEINESYEYDDEMLEWIRQADHGMRDLLYDGDKPKAGRLAYRGE